MAEAGKLDSGDMLVVSGLHTDQYNVVVNGVLFGEGLLSVPRSNRKTLRLTRLADPSVFTEVAP